MRDAYLGLLQKNLLFWQIHDLQTALDTAISRNLNEPESEGQAAAFATSAMYYVRKNTVILNTVLLHTGQNKEDRNQNALPCKRDFKYIY